MDIGSPLFIVSAFLVVFTLLVIILLWLGGKYSKELPSEAIGKQNVTLLGYIFALVIVSVIILVFSLEYFLPNLPAYYKTTALIAVPIVAIIIEKVANKFGYKLTKKSNEKNV